MDLRREEAIRGYRLLTRPPRRDLLALVDLAALVCDVPMATINLITATEQHQVAAVGFDGAVCRREDSMCAAVLDEGTPVIVSDARTDDRFRNNPFVTGEVGNVRFYASHLLRTPEGVPIGTLCVFDEETRDLDEDQAQALRTLADRIVDVLELELTTEELRAANQRLETSNERLGAFAGQVSHDLKNPLAAITMSLEMARDEAEEVADEHGETVVAMLERASRGASRMQAMIGDLLAFARGGGAPALQTVDLSAIVADVLEDLEASAAEATVRVGELPTVQGDPVQMRALVQNLLANGLKFRRPDRPPEIDITATRVTDVWRVEVADNGRGIAPEEREAVFEPFARVDRTMPGTGIGLATCKRIVAAHGGRIGLEGSTSGGTIAWFELPAGN